MASLPDFVREAVSTVGCFPGNRIAVRFAYEWRDDTDSWYRSYGNENWKFSDDGFMSSRFASINDMPILGSERKYRCGLGRRPDDHPGLSDSTSSSKETQYEQVSRVNTESGSGAADESLLMAGGIFEPTRFESSALRRFPTNLIERWTTA
jgi:hypothetical protein